MILDIMKSVSSKRNGKYGCLVLPKLCCQLVTDVPKWTVSFYFIIVSSLSVHKSFIRAFLVCNGNSSKK